MTRGRSSGAHRSRVRGDQVPPHPYVASVDGRCAQCPLPQERVDVHGRPARVSSLAER